MMARISVHAVHCLLLVQFCILQVDGHLPDDATVIQILEDAVQRYDSAMRLCRLRASELGQAEAEQSHAALEAAITQLRHLEAIYILYGTQVLLEAMIPKIKQLRQNLLRALRALTERMSGLDEVTFTAHQTHSGNRGRPKFIITREALESLVGLRFSWTAVARLFGVGVSTIYRRRQELGILSSYTTMTNDELDSRVQDIRSRHPDTMGTSMILGHLEARGVHLANGRRRVRESLGRLDPIGTRERWNTAIRRRLYKVKGPGSLWHMDGNHKLIRWGFVIHGAIDGYSRAVTMLKASTDNKAETVKRHFKEALRTWPWPSRLRTDRGGENVLVGEMLVAKQGEGRGTWIQSPSVHNQRIERLWRDVRMFCTQFYIDMFHQMEESGVLAFDCPHDRFALHFVFLPRLNNSLSEFQAAWNSHGLRSEGSSTPLQLWAAGMLQLYGSRHPDMITDEPDVEDWQHYGVELDDGDFNMDREDVNGQEETPQTRALADLILPPDQTGQLLHTLRRFDPMQETTDQGHGMYIRVRDTIRQFVDGSRS